MTDVVAPKADYWDTGFVIDEADLEHLYNHLLETETPLSTEELAQAQNLGVDLFQGFLLAHPRPGEL